MQPGDAIYTVNIDATTRGCKVRPGYSEYANGFAGDAVKTIVPFSGSEDDKSEDRLFGVTNNGIYNISSSTTTPTKMWDFSTKSSEAGWASFSQFVNDGGDHILLLTDEDNGLYAYTESTNVWNVPSISGPTNVLSFVVVWKERVWYVEKDSTNAWYSDLGTFAGTLTKFNFGSKFRVGGYLVALYSWTLDSGDGPDDYLVAVSSAGDVVVYAGTDPSSSNTFGVIGRWYIGDMPAGRRIGSQYGGDLLLLSTYGLVQMSDLLSGKNPFTTEGSLSWKIQADLRAEMALTRNSRGWEVQIHPSLARIIVSSPKMVGQEYRQFVYEINLQAWSIWEKMPILTSVEYQGSSFFGSSSVKAWEITGNLDNVTLASSSPSLITWRLLTAYNDLGMPEHYKKVEFIRPVILSELTPELSVQAFFDYDLSAVSAASVSPGVGIWGTGLWGTATWAGGSPRTRPPTGAGGMGKVVAVGIAGASQTDTTLISIGIHFNVGGQL
jgi:hypothetical protein